MNTKVQSQFAAALAVVIGAWMLMIPVFTSVTGGALVTILVIGGVTVLSGIAELFWENVLPSWIAALAAVTLLISAFGFNVSAAASWHMALAALAALAVAAWDGMEAGQLERMHHLHT